VNSIGNIITEINKKERELKQILSKLSIHMQKRGLNFFIQNRVKKYFEYLHKENKGDEE
jgi:hypothetical protein